MDRNFLGIPVEGVLNHGSTRVAQRPIEELQPALQALLNDPNVTAFGWTQYTPYFMDGDPCEFSANDVWVKTTEDDPDEYPSEYYYTLDDHPTLKTQYLGSGKGWGLEPGLEKYQGTVEHVRDLGDLIQSGAFDNALLEIFGDHAMITVHSDRIEVETYSHD